MHKKAVRTMRRQITINLFWVTLILSLSRPGISVWISVLAVYHACVTSTVSVYTNTTVYYLYTLHKTR